MARSAGMGLALAPRLNSCVAGLALSFPPLSCPGDWRVTAHSLTAAVVSTPPCSPTQIPLVSLSGGPLGSTEALSDVASVLCHSCVGFVKHHLFCRSL